MWSGGGRRWRGVEATGTKAAAAAERPEGEVRRVEGGGGGGGKELEREDVG